MYTYLNDIYTESQRNAFVNEFDAIMAELLAYSHGKNKLVFLAQRGPAETRGTFMRFMNTEKIDNLVIAIDVLDAPRNERDDEYVVVCTEHTTVTDELGLRLLPVLTGVDADAALELTVNVGVTDQAMETFMQKVVYTWLKKTTAMNCCS